MPEPLDLCAFETRASDVVALKLLALSLGRHAPGARLHLFTAPLPEDARQWFAARANVVGYPDFRPEGREWDIKAEVLLWLLDRGIERPVWIDSDIILANRLPRRLTDAPRGTLVVAEEPLLVTPRGIGSRARDMGLVPRTGPADFEINTCILRVDESHRDLLVAWRRILRSPAYLAGKDFDHFVRPLAFQSDQSVLSALLGSARFGDVPITLLRESREVAQCLRKTGYRPWPRLLNGMRGTPAFVHAMYEPKPWRPTDVTWTWETLSPYRLVALAHEAELAPEERAWLWHETGKARFLRRLFRGNPDLSGWPLALRELLLREKEVILTVPEVTSGELMRRHGVPLPS